MDATRKQLESNIWKYLLYEISHRRHFIPILAIYFLTLPNTTAHQIGIYAGLGYLASFLFEIPSGYIADRIGHKKTLVIEKILMTLGLVAFVLANSLPLFIVGSVLMSVGFSFHSGTGSAFMHNTLTALRREKEYTKVMSKLLANVSIVSAILVALLPFTTTISIKIPLIINIVFDIMGLFVVLSLTPPPQQFAAAPEKFSNLIKTIHRAAKPGFYMIAIFIGILGGYMFGVGPFRVPYLEVLGLPIIYVGLVMSLSRVFWFLIGHNAHVLEEKIGVKRLLQWDVIIFPSLFLLTTLFTNPYIVGTIFALITGYFWGRRQIIINHFFASCITDARYKATMVSVANQIQTIFQFVVAFSIGYVMNVSYRLGFMVTAGSLFVVLLNFVPALKRIK
ncbi:TPA: MFS transporter [Candidatus Woesearchaeota archaeon]|nr:MFS transporter [Candidatus Woesearchaeota archaeon]